MIPVIQKSRPAMDGALMKVTLNLQMSRQARALRRLMRRMRWRAMELMLPLMLMATNLNPHLQLSLSQRIIASLTPTTSPNRLRRSSLSALAFPKRVSPMKATRMTRSGQMRSL